MGDAQPVPDDESILAWLAARERIAVFGFSEDPFHVGYLGEALVRALDGGPARADLYVWSRATSYTALAALHPNRLVRLADQALEAVGYAGGYAALSEHLLRVAGDRVRVDERAELPPADASAVHEALGRVERHGLRESTYQGTPVGWTIMASLAELTRSSYGDELATSELVQTMVRSYGSVYEAAVAELQRTRPDAVLLFNGRLLHEAAVREAAARLAIPTVVAEVGHAPDHFSLHWGSAHDRDQYARRMERAWQRATALDAPSAESVAASWFTSRRTGSGRHNPYVTRQAMGALPPLDDSRRRVVYFTSSDDEFLSAGADWVSPIGTQAEILTALLHRAEQDDAIQLIVREHPHTLLKNQRDQAWWARFRAQAAARGTTVVPPESSVDSYTLAESAHLVLSIGSTIGIEAAYLGVPSVTLGPTLYDAIGATTPAASIDEALAVSLDEAELAARRRKVLPWGYYWSTFGLPLQVFDPSPPLFLFGDRPLARRGRLQSLVPSGISKRRRDAEFAKRTGVRKASRIL